MRCAATCLLLALATVCAAAEVSEAGAAGAAGVAAAPGAVVNSEEQHLHRPPRWIVFRPMFVTKARQRQLRRNLATKKYWKKQRTTRALHFPAGVGDESSMALRVAVNDLLFQSAPANDLPERMSPGAGGSTTGAGRAALRPMLLARLRSASREREPEEAFLLMSTAGGRPAIVPAPTNSPQPQDRPQPRPLSKTKHNKLKRKNTKRRVERDTLAAEEKAKPQTILAGVQPQDSGLSQQLDAMASTLRQRTDLMERVKKYDAQGMYPAYSYTHGRYTREASKSSEHPVEAAHSQQTKIESQPKAQPKVVRPPTALKVKVKVAGDDDEDMDAAETIVFRPLFVHRERQAYKEAEKRRRSGLAKKPVKPSKPLRRRQPRPQHAAPGPAPRPAPARLQRRTYQRPRYHYQYSPYRRVVYYH